MPWRGESSGATHYHSDVRVYMLLDLIKRNLHPDKDAIPVWAHGSS